MIGHGEYAGLGMVLGTGIQGRKLKEERGRKRQRGQGEAGRQIRESRESKREQGRPLACLGSPWAGCKICDLRFARKMASRTQKAPTFLLPDLALDFLQILDK